MVRRHHKGSRTRTSEHTSRLRSLLSSPNGVRKLTILKRALLAVGIPVSVLSTSFLFSGKTYAASLGLPEEKKVAPIQVITDLLKNEENNKILGIVPNPIQPVIDKVNALVEWCTNIPNKIAEWSIDLLVQIYDLTSSLILKTPLWIFDNPWFENTTHQFSLLAIGLVSILSAVEGIKRMLSKVSKKHKGMKLKDIVRRWFIVAGSLTIIPYAFQKVFQGLNWVSELLINMNKATIKTVALPEFISMFDVFVLFLFDAVLITTVIPMLWKNGRRFFDILVLGISTPFALTAWIFDDYKHFFRQWWEQLKHLSLVQVFYAFFLLIIGLFMFGTPTPTDPIGFIIKLLVIIGGFARMINPPRLISKHLDSGEGLDTMVHRDVKSTVDTTTKRVQRTKKVLKKAASLFIKKK